MNYPNITRLTLGILIAWLATIFFAYETFLTKQVNNPPTNQVSLTPSTLPLRPMPPTNQTPPLQHYLYEDNEFVQLFYETNLPNLRELDTPPSITGNIAVDNHIITLATKRGYRLQRQPVEQLGVIEGIRLQQKVIDSWKELTSQAQNDGISFKIISGYRTIADQRTLFLARFKASSLRDNGREYSHSEIIEGKADATLDTVLRYSSIPGYSKHHTGYAIDIHDGTARTDFTLFANTPAYAWISKNNFANAKRFGFIPSYPPLAHNMGPGPETWEFVWVGNIAQGVIN